MKSQNQPGKKKQRTAALGHDSEMDCVAMKQPVGFFAGPVVLEDIPVDCVLEAFGTCTRHSNQQEMSLVLC